MEARDWINQWADVVGGWIRDGLTPYVFTHSPNDDFAPDFAREFHARVSDVVESMPPLKTREKKEIERQGELF
jgi:hypothetical protein